MIDTNQQLSAMLRGISAMEPENDSAEAHVVYYQQIAYRWFQVAGLMAAETVAADELVLRDWAVPECPTIRVDNGW